MGNQSSINKLLDSPPSSPSKKKFTKSPNYKTSPKSKPKSPNHKSSPKSKPKSKPNSPDVSKKATTNSKQFPNSAGKKSSNKKKTPTKSVSKPSASQTTSTFLKAKNDRSARRNPAANALLLRPGPGLLQRAQKVDQTLTGFPVTSGEVTELFTISEQAEKAKNPRTPARIQFLMLEPFNQLSVITEHLGLTGVGGLVVERLAQFVHPIKCLINVTYEGPLFKFNGIETYRIPVADDKGEEISIYFDEVTDKLEQTRLAGSVSIVHCMAGVSRSASFVIAYLMRHQDKSLEQAFRHVKQIRSIVTPNMAFLEQLSQYERKLRPQSECSPWLAHSNNGITKQLPEFIINNYIDDYKHEFNKRD